MEGFFSSIIPILVIISIIAKIIDSAKKNQQKSDKETKQLNNQPQSLQSLIREQVSHHKDVLLEQFNSITNVDNQSVRYKEGDKLNRNTLEGTPVENRRYTDSAHIGGRYNEGDKLDRNTLEGITLEGNLAYGEGSMSLATLDLDNKEVLSAKRIKKAKVSKPKKYVGLSYEGLKFDRNNIVNGIIMAEVLTKRGGRR
jgi:hypothetical protein